MNRTQKSIIGRAAMVGAGQADGFVPIGGQQESRLTDAFFGEPGGDNDEQYRREGALTSPPGRRYISGSVQDNDGFVICRSDRFFFNPRGHHRDRPKNQPENYRGHNGFWLRRVDMRFDFRADGGSIQTRRI